MVIIGIQLLLANELIEVVWEHVGFAIVESTLILQHVTREGSVVEQ